MCQESLIDSYDCSTTGHWDWANKSNTGTYEWMLDCKKINNVGKFNVKIAKPLSPEEKAERKSKIIKSRMQKIIHDRCSPNIIVNNKRNPLATSVDVREQRARETLKRIIGENKYKNLLKHGFVSVKANSGLIYQLFPGHGFTNVYNKCQMVDCLCVILNGNFPPTDSLIMRYLLILNNEQQFRSYANKQPIYQANNIVNTKPIESLVNIFNELKSAS